MRVLIVDDDEDICMILELIFKKKGWEASYCTDGEAAIKRLKETIFDVVFLDILMPGMDGNEVLKKIRKDPKIAETPVVFLTAKDVSQAERAELIGLGAQGIYLKPVDPIAVIESATQYIKK